MANIVYFKVESMQSFIKRSRVYGPLLAGAVAISLVACGGASGGSSATTPVNSITGTLGGVAAVGSPISRGAVKVICASGSALASTTGVTGAWQISLREQTLPCAVQISGGTIGAVTNTTFYHSVATAKGNVNLTPLTDLVVANMVGTATPVLWFSGLSASRSAMAGITSAQVTAAVVKLRTALPELTALASIHPIATSFWATPGNPSDDVLAALQTAMDNSGVTYADLLGNASDAAFTAPPASFSAALSQAYANLTGVITPGLTNYSWSASPAIFAAGAIETYVPSVASLTDGKLMAVFAQKEASGIRVYASLGNSGTGSWEAPVALTGSIGSVQGVLNSSGWNQPTPATVVVSNVMTGNALAAWTTQVPAESTYRVWVSSYNAATNTWGGATQVGVAVQPGLKSSSSVAGGLAIAWLKSSSTDARKVALGAYMSSNAGVIATDELELGVISTNGLKIGLSSADMLVVAWSGANQQIMLARRGTSSWSSPMVAGAGAPSDDANIDLAVAADGSGAAVWRGLDPSIRTAVFDASGLINSTALVQAGSVDNARPAIAVLGPGKFIAVFAATSIGAGSFLSYTPYSATYDQASGWGLPVLIDKAGQAGSTRIAVSADGNALAVIHGANQRAYTLAAGGRSWTSFGIVEYEGNVPSLAMDVSTGRAAILWSRGSQLVGDFYR